MIVNRSLKNKAFDHIDHALGRPVDPMAKTYREYFATDRDSALAAEFRNSPHWEECSGDSRMSYFYVTQAGRKALADHLREIGDHHRSYCVTYDSGREFADISVIATSRSKAKREAYYQISDTFQDLTFGEFIRSVTSVRMTP